MTDKAQKYVDSLNVPYSSTFVPQSQSRNAGDKHPSLNWRVTFGPITTDYMQGIAHMPGYKFSQRLTVYEDERQRKAAESGRVGIKAIPSPKLIDVLYSLVMDSDAIEYPTYEDWAETFGYDVDSRKGEKIYRACLEIALKLRQVIDLDEAREAFQDY